MSKTKGSLAANHHYALQPIAESLAAISRDLASMSMPALKELREACAAVTQTNCWVYEYQAAKLIEEKVELQIKLRNAREVRDEQNQSSRT